MSERRKGLPETLLEQGTRIAARAAKAVVEDPRGQEALAAAVGAAQKGKRALEEVQGRVLHAAGLPTRGDYDEVARSMARLKRKLREISRHVDGERKR